MGTFLFGLVVGGNLAWVFIELRRNSFWRKFNARRRGGKGCSGGEITKEEWEAMRTHFIKPTFPEPRKIRGDMP
jgi:hypothetical protein